MHSDGSNADDAPAVLKVCDDPDFAPFFKMLRVGVPHQSVVNKMKRAGLDPAYLEYVARGVVH